MRGLGGAGLSQWGVDRSEIDPVATKGQRLKSAPLIALPFDGMSHWSKCCVTLGLPDPVSFFVELHPIAQIDLWLWSRATNYESPVTNHEPLL
jgi:hypothetical protein